jgi:glyoxylate/hydroxypyruvate reductase
MKPSIFFHSEIDSAEGWRAALATQFEEFLFSTLDSVEHPETVDIALIWTIPDGGLRRFRNLRAILSLGAGINQLDLKELPTRIPLARLVDASLARTMADYAKAAVYRYHRRFDVFERHSRDAKWQFIPATLTRDTVVGVLGLGEIGREIALSLHQEGFQILGWSRTPKHLDGVQSYVGRDELHRMVGECHILINVLPLTNETRHILSRQIFCRCRAGMQLINMGRGLHLVESDLLEALQSRQIAGATLDVATVEPLPRAHPFWSHPRILITPHVAGTSIPMLAVRNIAANIRRAIRGDALLNKVDVLRGY